MEGAVGGAAAGALIPCAGRLGFARRAGSRNCAHSASGATSPASICRGVERRRYPSRRIAGPPRPRPTGWTPPPPRSPPEPVGTSRAATRTALLRSRRDVRRTPSRSTHCALGGQWLPRTGGQSRTAHRPRTAIDLEHAARIALPRRRSIGCLNERRTLTHDRSLREDRDEPRADAVPNHGILRRRRSSRRFLLHRCCLGLEWRARSTHQPDRTGLRSRMQLVPDEGRRKARIDLRLDRRTLGQRPIRCARRRSGGPAAHGSTRAPARHRAAAPDAMANDAEPVLEDVRQEAERVEPACVDLALVRREMSVATTRKHEHCTTVRNLERLQMRRETRDVGGPQDGILHDTRFAHERGRRRRRRQDRSIVRSRRQNESKEAWGDHGPGTMDPARRRRGASAVSDGFGPRRPMPNATD